MKKILIIFVLLVTTIYAKSTLELYINKYGANEIRKVNYMPKTQKIEKRHIIYYLKQKSLPSYGAISPEGIREAKIAEKKRKKRAEALRLKRKQNKEQELLKIKVKIKKNRVRNLKFKECKSTYLTEWEDGECVISKKYKYEKLKNQKKKLATSKTYLGIKMYSSIAEYKDITLDYSRYKGKFKILGLNGEVFANDFDEIERIIISGNVTKDKANKIQEQLLKKYKLLDKRHSKKTISAKKLNDKAYNLYLLGLITGPYYKMYANNLTDKIIASTIFKFSNNNDVIILTRKEVTFKNNKTINIKVEYFSSQWLNKLQEKKKLELEKKKKNQNKQNKEFNNL